MTTNRAFVLFIYMYLYQWITFNLCLHAFIFYLDSIFFTCKTPLKTFVLGVQIKILVRKIHYFTLVLCTVSIKPLLLMFTFLSPNRAFKLSPNLENSLRGVGDLLGHFSDSEFFVR